MRWSAVLGVWLMTRRLARRVVAASPRGLAATSFALVVVLLLLESCGARSELWIDSTPRPVSFAYCPAALFVEPNEPVTLHATVAPSVTSAAWTLWNADDSVRVTQTSAADAEFRSSREGEWWLSFRAEFVDDLPRQCATAVFVRAAQALRCPNEVSCSPSETVAVSGELRSSGRNVATEWAVETAAAGSRAALTSTGPRSATLLCDVEGEWVLAFRALPSEPPIAPCSTRVRSRRSLAVDCPPSMDVSVFDRVALAPRSVRNATGVAESFRWELIERPQFSNAQLLPENARESTLATDMAGVWDVRLTVSAGSSTASCTTRVNARYTDSLRVELHTNPRRDCPYCNSLGGGQRVTLQLTDDRANGGVYPGEFRCQAGGCTCTLPPASMCSEPRMDWPPAGPVNDPRKDIPTECTVAGLESTGIRQATGAARFGVGVMYQSACGDAVRTGPEWPASALIRVYCGGRLAYQSEVVDIPDTTRRVSNVWRIGTVQLDASGGCSVQRRCPAGADQRGCIGDPQSIYDR